MQSAWKDSESSDDEPKLSAHALAALAEFEQERLATANQTGTVSENWQLSQFWYDERTATALTNECKSAGASKVACISCPTLYDRLKRSEEHEITSEMVSRKSPLEMLVLLEYDERFVLKYGSENVITYDYRHPLVVPEVLKNSFDLIVFDPPFLSEECFIKIAQTVRCLSATKDTKLICCSGTVMGDLLSRIFGMKMRRCQFEPSHSNNLANEFSCFANYQTAVL